MCPVDAQPPAAELIAFIQERHREREDFLGEEGALTRRIRRRCCWLCDDDTTEGNKLYKAMLGKGEHPLAATAFALNIKFLEAREIMHKQVLFHTLTLKKAVRQHSVWQQWAKEIYGFGELGFGQVIAEAGDLNRFSGPAKLWRMMGVGRVEINGELVNQHKSKAYGDIMKYPPKRHAIMRNISIGLVNKNKAEYRAYYDSEKQRLLKTRPNITVGHRDNDARRRLVKRLLRNMWRASRAATGQVSPTNSVPPASSFDVAAE